MRTLGQIALVAAVSLAPQLVYAQSTPPARQPAAQPTAQPAAPASGDSGEARKRYEVGLKLYDENNWEAARIEFERAYALNPSFRILYNIGLVYRQLNNYTASLNAFERYLAEGRDLSPERQAEVQKEITELTSRIGLIRVTTGVAGAEILVDDLPAGKAPMAAPLRVNPGIRKFSAQAKGHLPASKTLPISTGENPELKLDLVELPKAAPEKNPWVIPTIVGWSLTGLALGGTVITGVLALDAKSDQEDMLKQAGPTRAERDDARDKTTTLSGANNLFLAGTIVFAGLSTLSTLKMISWKPHEREEEAPKANKAARAEPRARFAIVPAGLGMGAVGTF